MDRGKIKVQEEVALVGFGATKKAVVTGVEMFRKLLDEGQAGDNVGLLLRGLEKTEIERGMVLAEPGSITPHTKYHAEVYAAKEEGGRHARFSGVPAAVLLPDDGREGERGAAEGVETAMPGDNVQMTITLITRIAMEEGLRFAMPRGWADLFAPASSPDPVVTAP